MYFPQVASAGREAQFDFTHCRFPGGDHRRTVLPPPAVPADTQPLGMALRRGPAAFLALQQGLQAAPLDPGRRPRDTAATIPAAATHEVKRSRWPRPLTTTTPPCLDHYGNHRCAPPWSAAVRPRAWACGDARSPDAPDWSRLAPAARPWCRRERPARSASPGPPVPHGRTATSRRRRPRQPNRPRDARVQGFPPFPPVSPAPIGSSTGSPASPPEPLPPHTGPRPRSSSPADTAVCPPRARPSGLT